MFTHVCIIVLDNRKKQLDNGERKVMLILLPVNVIIGLKCPYLFCICGAKKFIINVMTIDDKRRQS